MRTATRFLLAWLMPVMSIGCGETRMEGQSAVVLTTLSDADRQELSPEVRRVYDALVNGTLIGAQAADYQSALDEADETRGTNTSSSRTLTYAWNLTEDRFAEHQQRGEPYEGPPLMWVRVQKKYGHIYEGGISHPEY